MPKEKAKATVKEGKLVLCHLKLQRIRGGVRLTVRSDAKLRDGLMTAVRQWVYENGGNWDLGRNNSFGFARGDYRALHLCLKNMEADDNSASVETTSELYSRNIMQDWINRTRETISVAWKQYAEPLTVEAELVVRHFEEL
jgi:hypothetical protein